MLAVIRLKVMSERSLVSLETIFDSFECEVDWDLTMKCNYWCTYCESYNNEIPSNIKDLNTYIAGLNNLSDYLGNKKARITLLGGEPMLFKHWDSLLNCIYDKNHIPRITTNLSVPLKTLIKKCETLKAKECFDVTWHTQFDDVENYLPKVLYLHEKGLLRKLSIMADRRYWNKVVEAYESVKHLPGCEINRIKDESHGSKQIAGSIINYTEDEINYIEASHINEKNVFVTKVRYNDGSEEELKSIDEYFSKNLTNFKGMYCEVGVNRFHIFPSGDIYPSACFLNHMQARIGNIYKNNFKKITRPVKCPFNFCGCGPDMRITKYAER